MAKYSYITDKTHNNRKIQVESAKRDGSGKNIENNYAKQNGNYQSLTAGLSNNFDTKKVMVDESAYNFRPTATMGSVELEVGSPCKVKKIIGGSVAFNQLIRNGNFSDVSVWTLNSNTTYSVSNNVATIVNTSGTYNGIYQNLNTISGHKYLLSGSLKVDEAPIGEVVCLSLNVGSETKRAYISGTNWNNVSIISNGGTGLYPYAKVSLDYWENKNVYAKNIVLFDLTQMFGSTIADYIYSLEQANAGSGVAWFKRYFPKEYYAYNSGELVSVKTQGKKITHFNQWDEEWEVGRYNDTTGVKEAGYSNTIRSKNFISVFPNTQYKNFVYGSNDLVMYIFYYDKDHNFILKENKYCNAITPPFTTPTNCFYITFYLQASYGTTYNHDICINFHYDGERDGEYEPYNSETYSCDDVELRGIPQLDENNNLAFDGDEYANDGNVTRKYGIVDLSQSADYIHYVEGTNCWEVELDTMGLPVAKANGNIGLPNVFWTNGQNITYWYDSQKGAEGKITVRPTNGRLELGNGSTTIKPTGVVVYEIATPTDENSIPFTEVQECDNWGTEEWLAPTTDTRPCEVPVGHETDYLPDLKAKVEVAPNTPNENGVYVMEHNASGNSYTHISTWLADNGYVKSTDVANGYGTKDALGGTLRQLLASKNNIDFLSTDYIDLGTLSYSWRDQSTGRVWATIPNKKSSPSSTQNVLSTLYKTNYSNSNGCLYSEANTNSICIQDSRFTSVEVAKQLLKGVLLAYEKAS